jgi:hypothetical protein
MLRWRYKRILVETNLFLFTGSTAPLGPGVWFLRFMIILQTLGLLGRVISSSQGRYLNTGQHRHRINTYTHQTSMCSVGFETTIPASKRAKTVHALDRSATVTGAKQVYIILVLSLVSSQSSLFLCLIAVWLFSSVLFPLCCCFPTRDGSVIGLWAAEVGTWIY